MAAAVAHLHVVAPSEIQLDPEHQAFIDTIEGLEKLNRKLIRDLAELKRDKQAEAEESRFWPLASRVFLYHGRLCEHEGDEWGWEQFELILPKLRGTRLPGKREDKERKGLERCLRAIAGAHYDPWKKRRKNGSYYSHNSWNAIFGRVPGKASNFEEFIAKSPKDWTLPRGVEEFLPR